MQKKFVSLLACLLLALPAFSNAATIAAANSVNTAAIQNLAVTTAKIADSAVTGAKIAAGSVGTSALANSAVTGAKLASGSVGASHLTPNAVTGTAIAADAVTDAKISGIISGAKLGSHAHSGADLADNSVTAAKIAGLIGQDKLDGYSNTYLVHKGPANNVTTFNSVRAVIDLIFAQRAVYGPTWPTTRQAVIVMPGRYEEDLSILEDRSCDGARNCTKGSLNLDIIGASRTGTVIVPINDQFYDSPQSVINMPVGFFLKNLSIDGIVTPNHTQNSGIIGCDIKSNWHAVSSGWENIKNFVMDDVNIEATNGHAILLMGNDANDTLKFNNITIKNASIHVIYPISSKPFSFSNITFTGDYPAAAFRVWYGSNNVPAATFNFDNITIKGNYTHAFDIADSSNMTLNVTNSKLAVTDTLMTPNSGGANNTVNISGSTITNVSTPGTSVRIGTSKIGTIVPSNGAIKVVNSHNDAFDPYANGAY